MDIYTWIGLVVNASSFHLHASTLGTVFSLNLWTLHILACEYFLMADTSEKHPDFSDKEFFQISV